MSLTIENLNLQCHPKRRQDQVGEISVLPENKEISQLTDFNAHLFLLLLCTYNTYFAYVQVGLEGHMGNLVFGVCVQNTKPERQKNWNGKLYIWQIGKDIVHLQPEIMMIMMINSAKGSNFIFQREGQCCEDQPC